MLAALPIAGIKPLKTTRCERKLFPTAAIDAICEAAFSQRTEPDGSKARVTKNATEFADYVRVLQFSGAREKEALKICWTDVDFEREQVTIGAEGDTKNRTRRVVDLDPQLKAHLLDMRNRSG